MKKWILLATVITVLWIWASPSLSQERMPLVDKNEWKARSPSGDYLGTIKKENKHFVFYSKDAVALKEKERKKQWPPNSQKKVMMEWLIHNTEDQLVGRLTNEGISSFYLYDKDGAYLGLILHSNKHFMPKKTTKTRRYLSPEVAKLYLAVLDALENLEDQSK